VRVSKKPARTFGEPTVLWRLHHADGDTARATLIPGTPQSTLVYFINDEFERGENFDEWDPALRHAERVKARMLAAGWREDEMAGPP
jgi:hypothetical protein